MPVFDFSDDYCRRLSEEDLAESVEYIDSGVYLPKDIRVEESIVKSVGEERFDFGIFRGEL